MTQSNDRATARPLLRVWVSPLQAGPCVLDDESAHYLTRVHRFAIGQLFVGFDPERGTLAEGHIVGIERGKVRCTFEEPRPAPVERKYRMTLIQGIGKGDKPDRVVRAATELGVAAVHWVRTERSVVTMAERAAPRLERWKAVAIDAARQSGRPDLPELRYANSLIDAMSAVATAQLKLMLAADASVDMTSRLTAAGSGARDVVLLIGPEGGLSGEEQELALAKGFLPARLCDYVLRTETAAIAALGALAAVLTGATLTGGVR